MKNKKIKTTVCLLVFVFARVAIANEANAAEHGAGLDEHTLKTIIYQAINVGVLFAALIYFLKTPVQQFFKGKKELYLAAANKAQSVRLAAEEERLQIKVRLNKLESTADESVSRAKAEAADLRNSLLVEAENLSKRIREEAQSAAKLEVERAKNHLREQMIKDSIELSRSQMTKVTTEDHQRLQGEFINNIQAAQR